MKSEMSSELLKIQKIDEVWIKLSCSEVFMEMDLSDHFQFEVEGAKFSPAYKFSNWDGMKRLYNRKTKKLYAGLLLELLEFASKQGWKVEVDPLLMPDEDILEDDDLDELVKLINPHSNGNPIDLYDYQLDAVKHMMNTDRSTILASTSAGKSAISYTVARIYQLLDDMVDKTIFITVPTKALVEQLFNDFLDYSTFEGSDWDVHNNVQKISGNYTKEITKSIVITTWQSMNKLPDWMYESVGAVICDECHSVSAAVLGKILESAKFTKYRHGMTGTLDESEVNQLVIQGLLGPTKKIVSAKELIAQGRASAIEVHMSILNYPDNVKKELHDIKSNIPPKKRYNTELESINANLYRREFLFSMIKAMPGNSVVIFDRVEEYGEELYNAYKEFHDNTFLMVGKVDALDRERIRVSIEDHEDAVIFGSFGAIQTGISIKKLHNMFIISSSKSIVRSMQTIGRMMRLHDSKTKSYIFDIVDDLTYDNKPSYTMKHAAERIRFYTNEDFIIKFDSYNIKMPTDSTSIDDFVS